MSNFITFYSDEESRVLMGGNQETSYKSKYFAALCFMDKDGKFINIFLTREQLANLGELIKSNIVFIDAEHEKNETIIKEIEENLRKRENGENLITIDCFDDNNSLPARNETRFASSGE